MLQLVCVSYLDIYWFFAPPDNGQICTSLPLDNVFESHARVSSVDLLDIKEQNSMIG